MNARLLIISSIFFLFSNQLFAWNVSDHQQLATHALKKQESSWGLNRPVNYHPIESLISKIEKIDLSMTSKESLSHFLKINPTAPWYISQFNEERNALTGYQILSNYSGDPDDGRDQDLFSLDVNEKKQPISKDQPWFGSLVGPTSQAFRHMEKPEFQWDHWRSTFGFPWRKVGEATDRVGIYVGLSKVAFALDEDYWGYRFLACALHYVEDLSQPYHTGQLAPFFMEYGLETYFTWGWRDLGFIGSFVHPIANSHRFFETYIEQPKTASFDATEYKESAFSLMEGDEELLPKDAVTIATELRDQSNLVFPDLMAAVTASSTPELLGRVIFDSDKDGSTDPRIFLSHDEEAQRHLFEIVKKQFVLAGRAIRQVVGGVVLNAEKYKALEEWDALKKDYSLR